MGVELGERRRVGRPLDDVAVALERGQIARLFDRRPHVVGFDVGAYPPRGRRILSDKDLRAVSVVVVVAVVVGEQLVSARVVMFVDDRVGVLFGDDVPRLVDVVAGELIARRRDDGDVGVRLFDCIVERVEVTPIDVAPILVAKPDIFQIERLGVTVCRAHRAPRRRNVSVAILDQVEDVLCVRVELGGARSQCELVEIVVPLLFAQLAFAVVRLGVAVVGLELELADHADVEYRERLGAEVLAQLEVFVIAEREGVIVALADRLVAPDVVGVLALFERTDRVLPREQPVEVVALGETAAGETNEAGRQVVKRLDEVLSQRDVLPLFAAAAVCVRRHERDEVELYLARSFEQDLQAAVRGDVARQDDLISVPAGIGALRLCGGVDRDLVAQLRAVHAEQHRAHAAGIAVKPARIEGQPIAGALFEPHIGRVRERGVVVTFGIIVIFGIADVDQPSDVPADREDEVGRIFIIERRGSRNARFGALEPPCGELVGRIFETAVLDEFGHKSAVAGVRDILDEQPVQVFVDRDGLVGFVDVEHDVRTAVARAQRKTARDRKRGDQCGEKFFHIFLLYQL